MAELGKWAQTYCFEHEVVDECTVRAEASKWDAVEATMTEPVKCGPKVSTATLVVDAPVVVTFLCECGQEDHCWTSTSYEATANFTDEAGHYPENAKL